MKKQLNGQKSLRHIRRRVLSLVLSAALVVTMLPADISRASTAADSAAVLSKEAAKGVETTKASSDVKETVNTDSTKAENSAVEVESNTTKTEDTIKTTSAAGNTVTEGISGNEVSGADKVVGTKPGSVKTADGVPDGYTDSAALDCDDPNTAYFYKTGSTDGTFGPGTLYIKGTGTATNKSSTKSPWYDSTRRSEIQTIVIETDAIGNSLFYDYAYDNVRTIEIRDGVKSIGSSAFTSCYYVAHIDIPASVTSIASDVFNSRYTQVYLKDVAIRYAGGEEGFTFGGGFALGAANESHINYYVASADNAVAKAIKAQYEGQEGKTYSIKTLAEHDAMKEPELIVSAEDPYLGEELQIKADKNTTGIADSDLQYKIYLIGTYSNTEQKDAEGNPLKVFSTVGDYTFCAVSAGTDKTFAAVSPWANFKVISPVEHELTGDEGNKTLTIKPVAGKTTAVMPDYGTSDMPWADDKTNITAVVIKKGITNIGKNAFYSCKNLKTITLEDESNEWVIGESAFAGWLIAYSTLPETEVQKILNKASEVGKGAFAYNNALTSITIPENVKKVDVNAFQNCTALETVTIEAPSEAFHGFSTGTAFTSCSALTTVNLPSTWTEIPDYFMYNMSKLSSFTIPDGVITIGKGAFQGCSAITEITIPGKVTEIGDSAFYNCSGLTGIALPDSVITLGSNAFNGCKALETVTLSSNLETISSSAFNGCSLLTEITLPKSVKTIGSSAFSGCSALEPFDLPEGLVTIESNALPPTYTTLTLPTTLTGSLNLYYMKNLRELTVNCACEVSVYQGYGYMAESLEKLVIGEKVETIPENAYYTIKTLTDVTFPEEGASSLTTIGNNAFSHTSISGELVLPSTVTYIGNGAFSSIEGEGLTGNLVLPSSVTYVGKSAFLNSSLTSVVMEAPETEVGPEEYYTIGQEAFESDTIESIELKSPAILRCPTDVVGSGIAGRTQNRTQNPDTPDLVVKVHAADLQGTDGGTYIGAIIDTTCASVEHDTVIFTQEKAYNTQLAQMAADRDRRDRALVKLEVEGERETETGFRYVVSDTPDVGRENQTITITGYTGEATEVTIPEEIEVSYGEGDAGVEETYNNKVTAIGTSAFMAGSITKITLPETVTTIGNSAFQNCEKLTAINLEKVEHIGDRAFRGANVKVEDNAFDSLITIGELAFTNDSASSGRSQGNILLPDTVTSIGESAFQDLGPKAGETYSKITIPANDSYTKIEYRTFNSVVARTITIPANITEIGTSAFDSANVTLLEIKGEKISSIPYSYYRLCKYVYITDKDSLSYKTFDDAGYIIIGSKDEAKAELEGQIQEAEDALAAIVRSDYEESYLEKLEDGIKEAKAVLERADADSVDYLEEADSLKTLTANSFKKVSTEAAQKSLEDLLGDIKVNYDRDEYTEESWNNLSEVMDRVNAYLESGDCVNSELESLLAELQAAVNALAKKSTSTPGTGIGTVKPTPQPTQKPGTTTVKVKKVTLKKVQSPKKKTLKVQWKKVSGATGYQIKIGTNSKMTKNKKVINIKKGKTVKKTIKKLKSKKKYYVKVRAYKKVNGKKYYGAWSKVKKIKVK